MIAREVFVRIVGNPHGQALEGEPNFPRQALTELIRSNISPLRQGVALLSQEKRFRWQYPVAHERRPQASWVMLRHVTDAPPISEEKSSEEELVPG